MKNSSGELYSNAMREIDQLKGTLNEKEEHIKNLENKITELEKLVKIFFFLNLNMQNFSNDLAYFFRETTYKKRLIGSKKISKKEPKNMKGN